MECPRAALFDLDDTLAPTLQAPEPVVTQRLLELLAKMPVCIMTGRDFPRIQESFLGELASSPDVKHLYLLVSGASQGYRRNGKEWEQLYTFDLGEDDRRAIRAAIEESVRETAVLEGLPCYGERYVDKGSMISYAMLGVPLPRGITREWDPGNAKRGALWKNLAPRLPQFDVVMGGMTAIDIARKGINKAYGVKWLSERLGIPAGDMLYVGDALYEGGNDAAVIPTGIRTRATSGPQETLSIINEILGSCADKKTG
ncbi:MAG: HAD-IIB family hydrolase [Patescibacteria group bacterium]|nr:HAD-IIB family hydrolase [Patescibacteria group bacterium]